VLKKDQFNVGQALFALRHRERELISEISGKGRRGALSTPWGGCKPASGPGAHEQQQSMLAEAAAPLRRSPEPARAPAGGQGQNRNLAARLMQLDEQATRQQEVLYDVEFALQVSIEHAGHGRGEGAPRRCASAPWVAAECKRAGHRPQAGFQLAWHGCVLLIYLL
jgi:hypothetical protein